MSNIMSESMKRELKFHCKQCSYRTKYRTDLKKHTHQHARAKYKCHVCNHPFMTSGFLHRHIAKSHGVVEEFVPYNCGTSTASSLQPTDVVHHYAVKETGKRRFRCTKCNVAATEAGDIRKHIRRHFLAKFHCDVCKRPFMLPGKLQQHLRSHQDDPELGKPSLLSQMLSSCDVMKDNRLFNCSVCPYISNDPQDAHRHKNKHNNCKFQCSSCSMPFVMHGNMERHVQQVHGTLYGAEVTSSPTATAANFCARQTEPTKAKKSFTCRYCNYVTSYRGDLTKHVKRHNTALLMCRICKAPFTHHANLVKHLEREHEDSRSRRTNENVTVNEMKGKCVDSEAMVEPTSNRSLSAAKLGGSAVLRAVVKPTRSIATQTTRPVLVSEATSTTEDLEERFQKPYVCGLCFQAAETTADLQSHVISHLTAVHEETLQLPDPQTNVLNLPLLSHNADIGALVLSNAELDAMETSVLHLAAGDSVGLEGGNLGLPTLSHSHGHFASCLNDKEFGS